ncbi:zinc ABC transporter substrate-binding protein [Paenarthrobacter ilicis]
MRRAAALALTVLAALTFSGCSAPGSTGKPQVVVTTNILGDVTREVLGEQVEVTTLMQPNADPHSFEDFRPASSLHGARGPGGFQRAWPGGRTAAALGQGLRSGCPRPGGR